MTVEQRRALLGRAAVTAAAAFDAVRFRILLGCRPVEGVWILFGFEVQQEIYTEKWAARKSLLLFDRKELRTSGFELS